MRVRVATAATQMPNRIQRKSRSGVPSVPRSSASRASTRASRAATCCTARSCASCGQWTKRSGVEPDWTVRIGGKALVAQSCMVAGAGGNAVPCRMAQWIRLRRLQEHTHLQGRQLLHRRLHLLPLALQVAAATQQVLALVRLVEAGRVERG